MSVGLAQMLDHHLNPLCRETVFVATLLLSQCVKFCVPKFLRISRLDTLLKLCLPKLQSILSTYSSKLHKKYHHYRYHHVGNVTNTNSMQKSLSSASLSTTHTHKQRIHNRNNVDDDVDSEEFFGRDYEWFIPLLLALFIVHLNSRPPKSEKWWPCGDWRQWIRWAADSQLAFYYIGFITSNIIDFRGIRRGGICWQHNRRHDCLQWRDIPEHQ